MFVCVYDDGEIASDAQTGVYFASAKTIMIRIHRGFGLSKLIRIIMEKANRDPRDGVPLIHFKFPTKVCGQHVTYTTTQIQDDDDLDGAFDMIQATPTVTSIELCTTYNSGTRPSENISLTHFDAHHPHPNTEPQQELFDLNTTYLGDWGNDIKSYTELLTGPSTSNIFQTPAHHNTQRSSPPAIIEVENLGLPTASLDAFSEDEDNILFDQHDDHDQTLDVHPIQQQHPHPHPQTHVPYNPPQHFQLYEEYNQTPHQEFPNTYDHHTMLHDNFEHDVGTLTQGMRFQTKEQLLDALNRYHITNHCTYKTTHSNTTRLRVQCVQHVCPWKCQAILRTRDQVWEIRKVEGVHTCATQLITQDHRHLGSRIISQHVRQMVESEPSTPIATIISSIQTSMGYNTTYKKTWLVKQQAIEDVYGNWEQSYN